MSRYRISQLGAIVAASVLLLLLPRFIPELKVHLVTEIFVFALFAVGFNLLFGYAGLLAFGFGALFGIGAYTSALIFVHVPRMPLLLTFVIASLSGFLTGGLIGSLSLRLKGTYFALITFAFQMFLFAVALKWRAVTKGDDGMGFSRAPLDFPFLGSVSMGSIYHVYYLILAIVVIGILAVYLFLKTPLGNSIICMRENEIRASFLGYNAFLTKLTAFSVAGLLAGLSGGLFAFFNEFVATNVIDMNISLTIVLMSIIGGTGHFLGPVLGVAFYIAIQDWLSSLTQRWWLFMGGLFVIVVLYFPTGLISLLYSEKIRFLTGRRGK